MGTPRFYRFDPFVLDTRAQVLFRNGVRVKLSGQPYLILQFLLERAGEVVTRDELRERLWPEGTFVDFQRCLGTSVMTLRRALRDSAEAPRYLATVQRVGYRFIAPVATEGPLGLSTEQTLVASDDHGKQSGERPGGIAVSSLFEHRVKPYAFGIVIAVLALLLRKAIDPFFGAHYPYFTLWFAVVLAARYLGPSSAITTLVSGGLGVWYFFLPPAHSFRIADRSELYGLVVFVLLNTVVISIVSPRPPESNQL